MSSAQVIRDCQTHFNPSTLFRPLIQQEADARKLENKGQFRRRSRVKREIRVKMGHGGTLDPLATGVLILGVGKGTKSLSDFLGCTKTYETVVLFGASTDTYDRTGRILKRRTYGDVTRAKVEAALEGFRGKYKQMPPLYSALKMNGKPLYEYAREGLPIPRRIETRDVEVTELEVVEWYEPGEHQHRWPADEAGAAEQTLAERVWRMEKHQATGKKLSAEEEKSDIEALAAHEAFKRKADEKQDELVFDRPSKRRAAAPERPTQDYKMSGALGELPRSPFRDDDGRPSGKGSHLVPSPPEPNTPPPWEGKGPPAVKLRMTVTSGFYVRTLCHELGEKLSSASMMSELVRTRQSDFELGGPACFEYGDLARGEKVWGPQVGRMLRQWMKLPEEDDNNGSLSTPPDVEKAEADEADAESARSEGAPEAGNVNAVMTEAESARSENAPEIENVEAVKAEAEKAEAESAEGENAPSSPLVASLIFSQEADSTVPSSAPEPGPALDTPKGEGRAADAEWNGFSDNETPAEAGASLN